MLTARQDGDLRAAFFLEGFKCHDVVADPGYDADGLVALIRAEPKATSLQPVSASCTARSISASTTGAILLSDSSARSRTSGVSNPLRKAREKLPRRRRSRINAHANPRL